MNEEQQRTIRNFAAEVYKLEKAILRAEGRGQSAAMQRRKLDQLMHDLMHYCHMAWIEA